MRAWIAIAILSASWLAGLGYYHQPNMLAWTALVIVATALLIATSAEARGSNSWLVALVMIVPAIVITPCPSRGALLLLALGILLVVAPIPRLWTRRVGAASLVAGAVLLAQSLAMVLYEAVTARSHELPAPLGRAVSGIAGLLGITASFDGQNVAMHSMRQVHPLGATWELLLDPATWCFLVGGIVFVALRAWTNLPAGRRSREIARAVAALALCVVAWLPVRAALLMALYMHRVLITDYDDAYRLMNQWWSLWVNLALLVPPALLAWRFARIGEAGQVAAAPAGVGATGGRPSFAGSERGASAGRPYAAPAAALLAFACAALVTVALFYEPVGERKSGRVIVDEFHSKWEPTDRPFDTQWYGHLSGYNYYCIYDYCSRFYDMSRLNRAIDNDALSGCDVLILKIPTVRLAPGEVAAVRRFVERGGGLMLVGEHTNVFGSGLYLNDVARHFGFEYRYDCLFDIDRVFEQAYRPALVPHPIVQNFRELDFAVSCSIVPHEGEGRAAIRSVGLRNLPADYHASNFYPQVEDRVDARSGAFVQLWATRHGRGRVVAFTDSTQFSNFCTFEPGKSELMLGMIEWLNRKDGPGFPRAWLFGGALVLGIGALFLARRWESAWVVIVAAGLLGWSGAVLGVRSTQARAMPLPEAHGRMTRVTIDRTVSEVPLSRSGFIQGEKDGFGIFERWVLRLGYFTARHSGKDAASGDLDVVLYPTGAVPKDYLDALVRYVEGGGKLLVVDSPENVKSAANSILWPFGIEINRSVNVNGELTVPGGWPTTTVAAACEITGGRPFITLGGKPVAVTTRKGKGSVTVIAFGSRFADMQMGVTGDVEPDAAMKKVFELDYAIVRGIVEDRLPGR
jgi:hypothetical protein